MNERCPCGSGQKYKHCCFQKGFTYQLHDETGEVLRIRSADPVLVRRAA